MINNIFENFYPEMIDQIYYNNFKEYDIKIINDKEQRALPISIYDYEFDTNLNKYGFRSSEFIKDVDFLIAGCSVTYGDGLPIEALWHESLLKDTKYSYNSVAWTGDSINGQVQKIFSFIKKYNKPKNILFLIPTFNRIKIFNNSELIETDSFKRKNKDERKKYYKEINFYSNIAFLNRNQKLKKIIKRPFDSGDIISAETFHLYSAQSLNILEDYCKVAGINLFYTSWDHETCQIINRLQNKNYFVNFFMTQENLYNENNLNCHKNFSKYYYFKHASDIKFVGERNCHPGLHFHIHLRNSFAEALNNTKQYNFKIIEDL